MCIIPHGLQLLRGLETTSAESPYSSFVMNNRTTCWGLSRLPSLTSFSGLWKCFTIPLMASPTPSWIWPVFNSGWEEKGKQRCSKTIQARRQENPLSIYLSLCFLIHAFEILAVKVDRRLLASEETAESQIEDNCLSSSRIQEIV